MGKEFIPEGYINSYPVTYDLADTEGLPWKVHGKSGRHGILGAFFSEHDMEVMMQGEYEECGVEMRPECYGRLDDWITCKHVDNCRQGTECTAKCMGGIE